MEETRGASHVVAGTLVFDHKGFFDTLLRRAKGSSPFALVLLVDKEAFGESTPYYQRSRLKKLHTAGAEIRLCSGEPDTNGRFHAKAVVVDRRVGFAGSGNLTGKSERNAELVFEYAGPPVMQILEFLQASRCAGREWDGN